MGGAQGHVVNLLGCSVGMTSISTQSIRYRVYNPSQGFLQDFIS
jgi:hypothetical protein